MIDTSTVWSYIVAMATLAALHLYWNRYGRRETSFWMRELRMADRGRYTRYVGQFFKAAYPIITLFFVVMATTTMGGDSKTVDVGTVSTGTLSVPTKSGLNDPAQRSEEIRKQALEDQGRGQDEYETFRKNFVNQ